MIRVRRKKEIFHAQESWFSGDWHFSFNGHYDPENTQFGTLRVFNVDTLMPGAVWPMHPHKEMEVITYCVAGVFEHADSLGNGGLLYPGDVQHTTIGSGMMHSEINHSKTEPMTFIQVWILPKMRGLPPRVEQKHFDREERLNRFLPVVSNRAPGALPIEQEAAAYAAAILPRTRIKQTFESGWGAYLYLISGTLLLDGETLSEGDAAKIKAPHIEAEAIEPSELFMVAVRLNQRDEQAVPSENDL